MSDAGAFRLHREHPPVSRHLIVLLALLLVMQLRSDRSVRGGESPWDGAQGLRILQQVRDYIRARAPAPPSDQQLYTAAIEGMLKSLPDPYNEYLPPRAIRHLNRELMDEPRGGIGVQIREAEKGGLKVFLVLENMPAAGAGIQEGDIIVAVDGVDITRLSFRSSIELILGSAGSTVELQLRRDDALRTVVLTRVPLPRMLPCRLLPDADGIAYLSITLFAQGLERQLAQEIARLQQQGLRALIIDLRWSPGGALDTGVAVSDLFLTSGVITTVEERNPLQTPGAVLKRTHRADAETVGAFPVALLVDEYTASAAELFAAAMRDNGRARLVGGKTYGKGRIQAMLPLPEAAAAVSLTTGRYLTPKGVDLQGQGLRPDIEVDVDKETLDALHRICSEVCLGRRSAADLEAKDPQFKRAADLLRHLLTPQKKEMP